MPLKPGKTNIGKNIKTEEAAGKPLAQAQAIVLNVAGESNKNSEKEHDWENDNDFKKFCDYMKRYKELKNK